MAYRRRKTPTRNRSRSSIEVLEYRIIRVLTVDRRREAEAVCGVVMREGWNGLDLGKARAKVATAINTEMPLGMTFAKVTDQSVNIRDAVDEFMLKFFVALGVVMLVSFLSMGWRVGIVVAAAVPLTLAAVFIAMAATGKDFDRITLGSLILALGLLVDEAIIAIETMDVKMEEGYDRIGAAAYAWSHTAAPMLAGTLVTTIGFMPNGREEAVLSGVRSTGGADRSTDALWHIDRADERGDRNGRSLARCAGKAWWRESTR